MRYCDHALGEIDVDEPERVILALLTYQFSAVVHSHVSLPRFWTQVPHFIRRNIVTHTASASPNLNHCSQHIVNNAGSAYPAIRA